MKSKKILILGLGNEILTDDGIGAKLVKHFKEFDNDQNITYQTTWLGGLDILEFFDNDYDAAIFIDAAKTGKVETGTVEKYDLENFKETLHLSNFHDTSFLNTIKLADKLGYKVPKSINIISIEVEEDELFGNKFSKQIEARYQNIVETVSSLIRSISMNL